MTPQLAVLGNINSSIMARRGWRGISVGISAHYSFHSGATSLRHTSSLFKSLDISPHPGPSLIPSLPSLPAKLSSRPSLRPQASSWPHSLPSPSPFPSQRGAVAFLSPLSFRYFSSTPRKSCSAIIPSSIMADREILPSAVVASHYDLSITSLQFKDWTYQGNVT